VATVSVGILKLIRDEAEKAYPFECCGFLLGEPNRIHSIIPATNNSDEEKRRRFRIDPDDYISAEQSAAESGFGVIGFYHSHPDHPAYPSENDREQALPYYLYIIVAVKSGQAGDTTCWRLAEDRLAFISETLKEE